MESILQVVLVIICIAVIDDASAKIGITGSDLNLAVELPLELDNCREACLQKVFNDLVYFLIYSHFFLVRTTVMLFLLCVRFIFNIFMRNSVKFLCPKI